MSRKLMLLLAAVLALPACTRTGIGVAAHVGDVRITTSALSARVERGYANRVVAQSAQRTDFQRSWLNRLVRAELVRIAAKRLGVTVTDAQVDARFQEFADGVGGTDALEQQAAQQGTAKEDLRAVIRDVVLRDAVADKLVADVRVTEDQLHAAYDAALARYDQAHIAHIAVDDKKTATKVAAAARSGTDFAVLAKKYSKDVNTKDQGGDLGTIGNGDGKFQKAFEDAVFTGHTGSIVGPIKVASGYEVVKVVERRTRTFDQARDEVRRAVIGQERDKRLNDYLRNLAGELHVSINPRFGTWDATQAQVANATDLLSSPAPVPGG